MADTATKKVLGWGRCSVDGHDDIVEDSTSLDIEEGDEQEANIDQQLSLFEKLKKSMQ